MPQLNEFSCGTVLPGARYTITQENIDLFARASGDFNPLHIDPDFAKKTTLGGTVAHGMMVLAYISEIMTDSFGTFWETSGSLSARFRTPARPGDSISVTARIVEIEPCESGAFIRCEAWCTNQQGEQVINCTTKVKVENEDCN